MEAHPILCKMINWCEVILPFKVTLKNQALYFDYLTDFTHSQYWNG